MCFLIDCLIKDGFTDISFVMKSYSLIKIGFDIRCTSHHVTYLLNFVGPRLFIFCLLYIKYNKNIKILMCCF